MKNYPGTIIESHGTSGKNFLQGLFVAGNIMMGQICQLTGLSTPTLQNWINRGWISRPKGKKYDINQVARLLIINSLRNVLRLEEIDNLLLYVNGEFDDTSDDIIDESHLYYYICDIAMNDNFSFITLEDDVERAIENFEEKFGFEKYKLKKALLIITKIYIATNLIDDAKGLLDTVTEDNVVYE